jgi:hypothetical protein
MSKRLKILENSLLKKENQFNDKLQNHFDTIKQANGQPLNDKRNGQATLNKWDKQNQSLRNLKDSIEKTKQAIDYEKGKVIEIEKSKEILPKEILELIEKGELIQWRKHPTTFFVPNVPIARIVWDKKKKVLGHKYYSSITDSEQKQKFRFLFNTLQLKIKKYYKK